MFLRIAKLSCTHGSLPESMMTSEWYYYDCTKHPRIIDIIHSSDDIVNIDVEIEYITGNDWRKYNLISSMLLSSSTSLTRIA